MKRLDGTFADTRLAIFPFISIGIPETQILFPDGVAEMKIGTFLRSRFQRSRRTRARTFIIARKTAVSILEIHLGLTKCFQVDGLP